MPPPAMNRRDFVWSAAKVTAILTLAGCLGEENHPEAPTPQPPGLDIDALRAVCDRLLPGTPGLIPSASEAGVPEFVLFEHLAAEAKKQNGQRFQELAAADQDALLRRFQENDVAIPDFSPSRWFELVLTFALEGWLGPPSHGANKDAKTWDALGIVWPR